MTKKNNLLTFLSIFLTIFLLGCGGGGGGSATIPSVTSVTYSGASQIKTYSSGAQQSFDAVSSVIAWASDHITKTTTYTYSDGATNRVVSTVSPTLGTPTYAAGVQTIVTTYGDGTTSTATNNSTSAPVTWASDHVTKTTTYTFANGGMNPVVTTVAGVAGTPTYAAGVQTIVTTYGDGTTSTATNNSTSAPVTWASDHVTKTTTYTFANGGTNPVVTIVAGVAGTPTYAAGVQTIITTYGDGTTSTATNNSTSAPVTWAADHVTKTTTYTFANGGTNPVVTTVAGVAGTPTYAAGVQTIVTTYGDGTTATATNNSISAPVTWASDHVTKTTTYTFANGGTNPVVTTVAGVAGTPTYAAGVQTIVTTYGDGTTSTATNNSTSAPVTWASDHVTKTTTYTFANGATNPVVTTVAGVAGTPTYAAGVQTIVTTYGDGTTSTATNNSTSAPVTWASDHVTKTTTYTFANGATNPVVTTVAGTVSTPALTPPVYPANWTTTGTVTGPSVSSRATTYGDGYVSTAQDGTSSLPFLQTTLAALPTPITDPNANVQSSTTTYNLRWGTPDKQGPAYASAFNQGNSSFTYSAPLTIMGNSVEGLFVGSGPTYAAPHTDVIDAWNQGWTGKGVNVVVADRFDAPQTHGVIVTSLVARYAIGASYFGIPLDIFMQSTTNVFYIDGTRANLQTTRNIGVINTSFGAAYSNGTSDAARAIMDNNLAVDRSNWTNILKGSVGYVYQGINLTDAVITKSAGNDAITSDKESYVKAYADDSSIRGRLLVVGALDFDNNGKGFIASYSNTAGTDTNVKNRFVTAGGETPFSTGDIYLNGTRVNGSDFGSVGTSFAAPRVAGFAAIIRQKFPNLDAVKTSSIILDTARYDTLSCYPNCDSNIYGAGQASLPRALAPVGYLR